MDMFKQAMMEMREQGLMSNTGRRSRMEKSIRQFLPMDRMDRHVYRRTNVCLLLHA